jgi:hypothetical protein
MAMATAIPYSTVWYTAGIGESGAGKTHDHGCGR